MIAMPHGLRTPLLGEPAKALSLPHTAAVRTRTVFHYASAVRVRLPREKGAVRGQVPPMLTTPNPWLAGKVLRRPLTVHLPDAAITAVDGFQPVGTTPSGLIIMARRETATQMIR